MRTCNCNLSFANTGSAACKNLMAVTRKLILVPTYDSTGVRNKIASGDTVNAAYFTAAINNADATKRWYPTGLLDNVEDVRAEPIMETLNSQKKIFIQDGVRTFKGVLVEESNILIDKYLAFQCKDFSAYIIDKDRNLIGSFDGTDLYPIEIDKDTFYATLVKTTDSTSQKIQLSFEFARTERDEDLRMITESETSVNALLLSGLLDVNVTVSGITATGFTAVLTTDYGTFKNAISVTGWVKADFTLVKGTTVTITSVTESTTVPGTYVFVVPTQTSGAGTLTASKNGYEFPTTTVTFPS